MELTPKVIRLGAPAAGALRPAEPGTEPAHPALGPLWKKYQPLMQERLAALDAAASASKHGVLNAEQRTLALDAAHKFAGSLGMFGFPAGSEAARSIEHHLLGESQPDGERLGAWVDALHTLLKL